MYIYMYQCLYIYIYIFIASNIDFWLCPEVSVYPNIWGSIVVQFLWGS